MKQELTKLQLETDQQSVVGLSCSVSVHTCCFGVISGRHIQL